MRGDVFMNNYRVLAFIALLLYFVSPIDLIPGVWIDDIILVLAYAISSGRCIED